MGNTTDKIRKEIEKREEKKGRELTKKERRNIAKNVKTKIKWRNRAIAALGAIGLAVGGYTALNPGKTDEQTNKTKIEQQNKKNEKQSKREEYLKGLKTEINYEEQDKENEDKETKIVDQILSEYNDNLLDQAKISKEDLGIILQEKMGEAHIIKEISDDGNVSYLENYLKYDLDDPENQEWISAKDVEDIYVLVDKKNHNTIAGIGEVEGKTTEVDIEQIKFGPENTEYTKNGKTYIGIPDGVDKEKAHKNFSNYYNERLNSNKDKEKESGMELGE